MNYKGFNIAVHEMGHNVEQTFSLYAIDHYSLNGVPNTAFTEALAFVFQAKDLQLLGLQAPDAQAEALKALNDFWATYEICGVSLVDMQVWHWMCDHPQATPEQLRETAEQRMGLRAVEDESAGGVVPHLLEVGHGEDHLRRTGTDDPVEYLAQFFDLIEINTSFYGHIRPEWGKLWCRKAKAVFPTPSPTSV